MVSKRYECGTCQAEFPSKNQLKKHQRKQNPRHQGIIPILDMTSNNKKTPSTTTKSSKAKGGTTKGKKVKTAGNRASGGGGNWRTPKPSGPLEPVYQSGFIRIPADKWEEISDKLPDGASHHIVEGTNHHIIEFTGEAYEGIDYLMYLHNFVELEMYYQDILFCLSMMPPEENISVLDICELGKSKILSVDDGIIMTEYRDSGNDSISNEELKEAISNLTGIAVAFGKFKKDSSRKATTTTAKKTTTPKKTTVVSSPPKPKPVVDTSEKWTMQDTVIEDDPIDEAGEWYLNEWGIWAKKNDDNYCVFCGGELGISGMDTVCVECGLPQPAEEDEWQTSLNDFSFHAQEIGYGGGFGGSRGWGYGGKSTYTPPPPVIPKYHPIFGIRGNMLAVDRIVDLTPLIEASATEVTEVEITEITEDNTQTEDDPDFDPAKADRNKDGEISDWERKVGNAVAKGIRESKDKKGAEGRVEGERSFTLNYGPKRMYLVVEYNDGKELYMDDYSQFIEELIEAEDTGDEKLVEALFGVGSDYHGIAEPIGKERGDEYYAEGVMGDSPLLRGRNRELRIRQSIAKNWKPEIAPTQMNVTTTPVDMAFEWSKKQFQERGLIMSDYIPHFKENYLSLQEECRLAIDIPRIDMPVIDPDELEEFAEKLRGGSLDVFEPFALDGGELYSPRNLVVDSPEAINFLFLGYKDGKLEDDVVNAKIMLTAVGLMRPTQSQIWLNKIIDNIIEYGNPTFNQDGVKQGAFNTNSLILKKTVAISQEGYILDGHHRYAQIALVNPSLKMMTLYIGLPIRRLIEIARPYGNAIGNEQRAAEDSTQTN